MPPVISSVVARDTLTWRVTWSAAVKQASATASNDALNPANWTIAAVDTPVVALTVSSVATVSTTVVDLTLSTDASPGDDYSLTPANIVEVVGTTYGSAVTSTPTTVTAYTPPQPLGRRFNIWDDMLPDKNKSEDDSGDLRRFTDCLQDALDIILYDLDRWIEIVDLDRAPDAFLDAALQGLGNPFQSIALTEIDKRRLLDIIGEIYTQKGTEAGVINAVRFFAGVECVITTPRLEYGWRLPYDMLGNGTTHLGTCVCGPNPGTYGTYYFEVHPVRALTADELSRLTVVVDYMKPVHTHWRVGLTITDTSPLAAGQEGVAYTKTFTAVNGTAPYAWTAGTSTLPAGLVLSSGGVLAGTASGPRGTSTLSLNVTDSVGRLRVKVFSLFIERSWTWVQQVVAGPTARSDARMVYDPALGQPMLFGGRTGSSSYSNQTRCFDLAWSTWTALSPAHSPSARAYHGLAYDAANAVAVLFGGYAGSDNNETWTWDGTDWTQISPVHSPTARDDVAMVYDAKRAETVLFGGYISGNGNDETWVWDGADWTQKTTAHTPPARYGAAMAFDAVNDVVVMFGGVGNSGILNDTWTWDGSDWTEQHPVSSPSARGDAAMAFDASNAIVILFGGGEAGGYDAETWFWDGSDWEKATTPAAPTARSGSAFCHDPTNGVMLLFGGFTGSYNDETWAL